MRKVAIVAFLWAVAVSSAHATPVQVFNRPSLSSNDAVDWGQFAELTNPYDSPLDALSAGGLLVTAADDVGFNRLAEGSSWIGNFTLGDALLFTSLDGTNPNTSEVLTLTFGSPVLGLGANIEANYYGPFVAVMELFSDTFSLGVFSIGGISTRAEDGSAPYLGALDSTASITRAVFRITVPQQDCMDLGLNCGFAINQLDLRTESAVVPEPRAMHLVALGLISGALYRLRRRSRSGLHGHQSTSRSSLI